MRKTRKPVGSIFLRGLWLDVGGVNGDYCALVMQVIAPGVAVPIACYVEPSDRLARRLAMAHAIRFRAMVTRARLLVECPL